AHILSEHAAHALGRQPGMGFQFLEQDEQRLERLHRALAGIIAPPHPKATVPPPGTQVLVADESPRMLERLSGALGRSGFPVRLCRGGGEAYSACLEQPPDLILAADDMAVTHGWAFLRMLRAHPRLAGIPFVLMSADASDLTRLRAYRLGVADFVQKPFTD